MNNKSPKIEEIRATFAEVRSAIVKSNLCLKATIENDPIGRRVRGTCRLQVERVEGKGYRTVSTTTK